MAFGGRGPNDPFVSQVFIAGVTWHLHGEDGGVVEVQAGRFAFDLVTGETSWTPNMTPDDAAGWASVICPALGSASVL